MNIIEAMKDPQLFGPWFGANLLGDSWATWKVFLAALFGLPMTDVQVVAYGKYTGRTDVPSAAFSEAYAIVGRRCNDRNLLRGVPELSDYCTRRDCPRYASRI
jgi:hypothetical protein